MNVEVEELLSKEILEEIETLSKMEVGSEEWKKTIEGLSKLLEKSNEMDKIKAEQDKIKAERDKFKAEQEAQNENRMLENNWREKQAKEERIDRWVKNGIAVAGILIPVGVTIWGTLVSFKFEEEGTITTIMGRGFISKLLPKK